MSEQAEQADYLYALESILRYEQLLRFEEQSIRWAVEQLKMVEQLRADNAALRTKHTAELLRAVKAEEEVDRLRTLLAWFGAWLNTDLAFSHPRVEPDENAPIRELRAKLAESDALLKGTP